MADDPSHPSPSSYDGPHAGFFSLYIYRSQSSETFETFLHIFQLMSTCQPGVEALGKRWKQTRHWHSPAVSIHSYSVHAKLQHLHLSKAGPARNLCNMYQLSHLLPLPLAAVHAESLKDLTISYLVTLCEDDIVPLEDRQNGIGSALSVLIVLCSSWKESSQLIIDGKDTTRKYHKRGAWT